MDLTAKRYGCRCSAQGSIRAGGREFGLLDISFLPLICSLKLSVSQSQFPAKNMASEKHYSRQGPGFLSVAFSAAKLYFVSLECFTK